MRAMEVPKLARMHGCSRVCMARGPQEKGSAFKLRFRKKKPFKYCARVRNGVFTNTCAIFA